LLFFFSGPANRPECKLCENRNAFFITECSFFFYWTGYVNSFCFRIINGGVNRRTAHTTVMCAKTASGESLADSFWRAKRTARRQNFGERSELLKKKFDERSEPLAVFFFFLPNWEEFPTEMAQISARNGDGEFPPVSPGFQIPVLEKILGTRISNSGTQKKNPGYRDFKS
jgi:hypothetical protein